MRKLLFAVAAVAGVLVVAATPPMARASWLSQALHAYFDPAYYGPYYYGPAYGYYAPDYAVVPGYGYGYGYSEVPYYVPYRTYWYGPRYYRPWYGNPHRWHEWRERHEHHHRW